jgi:hypothetical protein
MSYDLNRDLPELGAYASATAPDLPTAELVRQLRRRRAVRAGLRGAGALVVVAAVVAGGVAFGGRREPTPPAATPTSTPTSTPTPSSSPQATPEAVQLPTGDATLPFGTCGSLVESSPASPVDAGFTILTVIETTDVPRGQALRVRTQIDGGQSSTSASGYVPAQGPTFAVVLDGVAVAVTDLYHGTRNDSQVYSTIYGFGLDLRELAGSVDLTVCGGQGDPVALPPGDYDLYAIADLVGMGDADPFALLDAPPDLSAGQRLTAVGAAIPFRITEAVGPAVEPDGRTTVPAFPAVQDPQCGDPAPSPQDVPGFVELSYDSTPRSTSATDGTAFPASLTYVGPGRVDLYASLSGWLVQDGVVVGSYWYQGDLQRALDTDRGGVLDVSNALTFMGCAGSSDQVAPGEYLFYPSVTAQLTRVTLPDGTIVPGTDDAAVQLVGEPIQLTVTG